MRKPGSMILLAVLSLMLAACQTLKPDSPEMRAQSDALLQAQFAETLKLGKTPKVWVATFILNSESVAPNGGRMNFEESARAVQSSFAETGLPVAALRLSNAVSLGSLGYPFATRESIAQTVYWIGAHRGPQDKVVLAFASHGAPEMLEVRIGTDNWNPITADWLDNTLVELHDAPTVVLVDACYSGSFLRPLADDQRVIVAAAAADKVSFSVNAPEWGLSGSVFVQSLFPRRTEIGDQNLVQMMETARQRVFTLETDVKAVFNGAYVHSMPQWSVGQDAAFASMPIRDWLKPAPVALQAP
ncbi:C13 family peptidase [Niveibacterium sp. SC-1]|uniref:C13 family peptidase n=1 Tax=Niveibacterium sp. SC-1 TaxID=3135646 RepID=UPI00311EC797